MKALAAGELDSATARFEPTPIILNSRDEVGEMARNFNLLQEGIGRAAGGLEGAREGLVQARSALTETNERLKLELVERRRIQEALGRSLSEKDALLKEVHHRVKNNMQVVSSLLNLQMDFLPDDKARPIIGDTQNRIAAMALVHEKLYQSTDLARIDFSEYLRELTGHLVGTFNFPTQGIGFALEAVDMFLGIDTAIPCGLIVNELISNAYKHGFPEGGPGTLTVTLKRGDDDFLHLTVADTGRGIRQGLNLRQTDSLGMQLVFTLVRQLHGTIDVKSAPGAGTTFELSLQEVSVRENEYALP
jgi:two-component sensor histidine kinase